MTAVKLQHSNQAQHQANTFKQLRAFRKEGQLCDLLLKSRDGTEHGAHKAVLCAASEDLRNMLVGPFCEANQLQQGKPMQMAASDAVVSALLEYIYGEDPQVELEDCLELLHLADKYNFLHLAATVQASLRSFLDTASVAATLKVLQRTQGLHDLQDACEEKVAANFELCIELADFLEVSASQLGRILRRADLTGSREEVVIQGLLNWFNKSKDRWVELGSLLQNVDFRSFSSSNLVRLQQFSASMGPVRYDLQREVREALQVHKRRSAERTPDAFCPKRRCLHNPDLAASSQIPKKVLPYVNSMCYHDGAIYCATYDRPKSSSILRWKPGDSESQAVAGEGKRVNGVNDLGSACTVSVCPTGEILVADRNKRRLLSFRNGSGSVVLEEVDVWSVCCAPSGNVYLLTQKGLAVEKLVGAMLRPMISSENLPVEWQFNAYDDLFVTKDEVIYLSDCASGRILRLNPGEAKPVVVGQAPNKERSKLGRLFVTEDKIYVADNEQRKVWAFHPGDEAWTEVLTCPGDLRPVCVLVHGGSLYVGMSRGDDPGVYEYLLRELQLE